MTDIKVQERNDVIVKLALEGLRNITILQHVNRMGLQREWEPLQDVRSVQRVVHDRLAAEKAVPPHKIREHQDAMFYAEMSQMEMLREKLALYRLRRKNWQPFEYVKHLESESKLLQRMYVLWEKKRAWDATMPNEPLPYAPETDLRRGLKPILEALDEYIEMQPA